MSNQETNKSNPVVAPQNEQDKICECGICINCKTNYRDALIEKLLKTLQSLTNLHKKLIGALCALMSSLIVVILVQLSFKFDIIYNQPWFASIFFFIRSIPIEIFIILGFIFASMASLLYEWTEIIFLGLIGIISAYWSFINREWFALAASLYLFIYSIVRTKILNKILDPYFLSFFKHSLIVVITLLVVNFILKIKL
jgi:hypothetical protein